MSYWGLAKMTQAYITTKKLANVQLLPRNQRDWQTVAGPMRFEPRERPRAAAG
tara:strand:- start:485 stop:643 length:159 start_codon:yes stop_codon:yes gene_type:complete